MAQVNLNVTELKGFVNHIITNNRYLQANGKSPVSVEVVGESGIGKTSTIVELAEENKLKFVKLNLAQIEELGDLVGFPVRQFQMYKEKTVTPKKLDDLTYTAAQRSAAAAYLAKMDAEVGEAGITLSHIMIQKYITLLFDPETWVDMRRMDYSNTIYPGLERPINVNLAIFPGENDWIQAMVYEYNEEDRNYENMPDNTANVRLTTPLWWNVAE